MVSPICYSIGKTVKSKMPWDVVLLLSGGFALAEATEVGLCLREKMR